MERTEHEWESICEYLLEKVAVLQRECLAKELVIGMQKETIENLKRKMDGAGVE